MRRVLSLPASGTGVNGTGGHLDAVYFGCQSCGVAHKSYVDSVNCCTWVAKHNPLLPSKAQTTIIQLEAALQSGIPLREWKAQ
jgi:hypothetical protein